MPAAETQTETQHTAKSLRARCQRIADALGPNAYVSADIAVRPRGGRIVSVCVYPNDIGGHGGKHFHADDFEPALDEAEAWAASQAVVQRDATIRRLALDIIDLTDQHGSCTVTLLRGRGYASETIAEYHEAACARAGEMSGNAPFAVLGVAQLAGVAS